MESDSGAAKKARLTGADEQDERPAGEVWDAEDLELADPDQWDWDNPEFHPGVKNPGAVVSIRFTLAEIEIIEPAAKASGKRLVEFMHDLVLEGAAAKQKKARTSKNDAA